MTEVFSGPLPPPRVLEAYNNIVSGLAEQLVRTFTDQAQHRMRLEALVVSESIRRSRWGLACGLTVALSGIGAGAWIGGAAGASAIGSTLVAMVAAFIYGSWSQRSERERKAQLTARR